jgi:hypothetical protein
MDEYDEMMRLQKEHGILVYIELEMRWKATIERIRDIVASGKLGKIESFVAYNYSHNPMWWYHWMDIPEQSYGKRLPIHPGDRVFRGGALTDHDPLTLAYLFDRFVGTGAFVIALDSCGNVSIQCFPRQAGGVSVDDLAEAACVLDFLNYVRIVCENTGIIHHFRKTDHAAAFVKRLQIACRQICSGFVKGRCGNAGGQSKVYVHGDFFAGFHHVTYAVNAAYVGDFMRIGNDGGRAVRQTHFGKLRWSQHGAFYVNMTVDEAGADEFAVCIFDNIRVTVVIVSNADDDFSVDQDVGFFQFTRKNVDDGATL